MRGLRDLFKACLAIFNEQAQQTKYSEHMSLDDAEEFYAEYLEADDGEHFNLKFAHSTLESAADSLGEHGLLDSTVKYKTLVATPGYSKGLCKSGEYDFRTLLLHGKHRGNVRDLPTMLVTDVCFRFDSKDIMIDEISTIDNLFGAVVGRSKEDVPEDIRRAKTLNDVVIASKRNVECLKQEYDRGLLALKNLNKSIKTIRSTINLERKRR